MARPLFPSLRLKDDRFSRLQGVSRFYGRRSDGLPLGTNASTAYQVLTLTPDGATIGSFQQAYIVVDKVQAYAYTATTGGAGATASMNFRITDGVTPIALIPFHLGTASQGGAQYRSMERIEWVPDGTLVLPPGYFLEGQVNDGTCKASPIITGWKVSSATARALGLNAMKVGGALNGLDRTGAVLAASTARRVVIPAVTGQSFRIRNVYIRGFAQAGTKESVTLAFSNAAASTNHTFMRVQTQRISLGHKVDHKINGCHATGPTDFGVTAQFNTTNANFSVVVTGEYLVPSGHSTSETAHEQVDPTGVFASPATVGAKYFWCYAADPTAATGLQLFNTATTGALGNQTYALIDGCSYNMIGDGVADANFDDLGINAGAAGGTGQPSNAILPWVGDAGGLAFTNATTNECNMSWNDLGGLPCQDPRICLQGYGTDSNMTVWGRLIPSSGIAGLSGVAN